MEEVERFRLAEVRKWNEIATLRSQKTKAASFYNTNAF
jgi:hypothetical protein